MEMRITTRPLEHARAMDEQEWQELLERQQKRMLRKVRRGVKHPETSREVRPKSVVDHSLQRFASLPRLSSEDNARR